MNINRNFYVYKFSTDWLKEFNFNINISFENAMKSKKIIALADNQMLRTIRDIMGKSVNADNIESLFNQRDRLKRMKSNKENINRLKFIKKYIYDALFIDTYAVITIDSNKDYDYIFKKGLFINGKKYIRASCSASQGRVSKVVFVEENVCNELLNRLDNGRDLSVPFIPSKYNAYLGTYSSATKIVSTPNIAVIKDCKENRDTDVWWVTEVDSKDEDDIIEKKVVNLEYNLFDGNGLISPNKAMEWSNELGLDYLPAEYCIRAPFIKGMVCVFDFVEWCKEFNNENYMIETIYSDCNGNPILIDVRDVDIILTESQFKMWNSYNSYDEYEQKSIKNGNYWGVSIYTPKEDKDILTLNYQFIQTLNLSYNDIVDLCGLTVDYFKGVSADNIYYTLLFLLGVNLNDEKISNYLNSSDNYWIKSLMVNHNLINDKYIKEKIYENIKGKLNSSCIGKIFVDGNFQVIVPDPFAFMQHATKQEVVGLLREKEYFSEYWNKKGVTQVDSMRSPLTYLSEHLVCDLKNNEMMQKWYKYLYTGYICNVHSDNQLRWSGSDFDYDIIATTSNQTIINGVYRNDYPVVYEPPKGQKKIFGQKDLQVADKFTFGSIIGQITNKVTSIRCLMSDFDEGSDEYNRLLTRMRMGCKMQSAQIDKAKIGRVVKGIPTKWVKWNKINDDDTDGQIEYKNFLNSLLCDRHPYFFIHLYDKTMKDYRQYKKTYDDNAKCMFGISLDELLSIENKTYEQVLFIDKYNKYYPVIENDSVMNVLCKHMENMQGDIKNIIKQSNDNVSIVDMIYNKDVEFNEDTYKKVLSAVQIFIKTLKSAGGKNKNAIDSDDVNDIDNLYQSFTNTLDEICSNGYEVANYMIDIFYNKFVSYNKNILWRVCGRYLYNNVCMNCNEEILIPYRDDNGEILYLGKRYSVKVLDRGDVCDRDLQ